MPREYKRDPRAKPCRRVSEEVYKKAIEEVQNGVSLRVAAAKYKIDYTVLCRRKNKEERGEKCLSKGGQTVLSAEVELQIVNRLVQCSEWGQPLDLYDLRVIVKNYLDKIGRRVERFQNNMPGMEFALGFVKRHKERLSMRFCQNIKRSRAGITTEHVRAYFENLRNSIDGVSPSNIVNYDETNLTDDPGRKRVISKRGMKYPERVMNHSKSATSLMFAAAADGTILPPFVVYRAKHMYETWKIGGPIGARFSSTPSGWFDINCFMDWIVTIAIPYFRNLPGKKVLIGDNLSSHISLEAVEKCEEHNISFVFLPANSSHMSQPLDVAFFRPFKKAWRKILTDWKKGPGRRESSIPKTAFPHLLKLLLEAIKPNAAKNVRSGFRKCGIVPINPDEILSRLPSDSQVPENDAEALTDSVVDILRELRYENLPKPRQQRKKVNVLPGRSVAGTDFNETKCSDSNDIENISLHSAPEEDTMKDHIMEDDEESLPDFSQGPSSTSSVNEHLCPIECFVTKNGKTFEGVFPVTIQSIKIDDWILVQFFSQKYIGRVQSIDENYTANFLRVMPSMKRPPNKTFFVYPDIPDLTEFSFDQIIGKVKDPEKGRRGILIFQVDATKWK